MFFAILIFARKIKTRKIKILSENLDFLKLCVILLINDTVRLLW